MGSGSQASRHSGRQKSVSKNASRQEATKEAVYAGVGILASKLMSAATQGVRCLNKGCMMMSD